MAKELYEGHNCEVCGNPMMKERWTDLGDMIELRITCQNILCKMIPYHITELKKEED